MLPAQPSRVLTRELVYTGVTRARHWFTLLAPGNILDTAIAQRVQRTSGLNADMMVSGLMHDDAVRQGRA
ncbi:RecBCD enzyme subunit RecD [compost metagenome]